MKFDTKLEAAHVFVSEMNAIPQGMIAELMENNIDAWRELTAPATTDRVYVYNLPDDYDGNEENGEIVGYDEDEELYAIELDDGAIIKAEAGDFEVNRDDFLPMWGTMWSFNDSSDDYWLEELDGLRKMSECGFRIYEHEEYGYYFGIDGAGYDFFEAHWLPLYEARGLRWHKEDEE